MPLQFNVLTTGFGAEVRGFDMAGARDGETIACLQAGFARHHLLLFRDCGTIAPERHVEICGWFGTLPENDGANPARSHGPGWNTLDNRDAAGSEVLPFHSDISFMPHPYEGLSLHPRALPDAPTSTLFVSNALGWNSLPEDLRARVERLRARHHYDRSSEMNHDWPPLEQWRPIRTPHRLTGEPLLYITEYHVDAIEGLEPAQSRALLDALFAVLYAPERQYEHVWRTGDLILFDNIAIQHSRPKSASTEQGPRIFQRVAIGPQGFFAQLAEARRAALST